MKPPSDLTDDSKQLWEDIVPMHISPGRAEMLTEALRCLDRLKQVRAELSTAKLTTVTPKTGAVHVNPLLKIETELRRQFTTIWAAMGLDFVPSVDGKKY